MVLPILVLLVSQLLDAALGLAQVLLRVGTTPVFSIHFGFKFTNAGLHLGHSLLAALECVLLNFVEACVGVFHLSFQHLGGLLFGAQFVSQASCIDHGALGLLL